MDVQSMLSRFFLGPDEIDGIREECKLHIFQPGQTVIREGAPSREFGFVKSGEAMVSRRTPMGDDEILSILKDGQFFGEIGLLEDVERTASVKAIDELHVYLMDRARFLELYRQNPAFSKLINTISRLRLLRNVPVFDGLGDGDLAALQSFLTERSCEAGEVVFREGDDPDALYIVVKGRVQVTRQLSARRQVVLAALGEGDFFGEMGLIEDQPRSATVTAVEVSRMLVMSKRDFMTAWKADPMIAFGVTKVLSRRLREKNVELSLARGANFFRGMTIISRPERCLSCKSCEVACAVSKSRTRTLFQAVREDPPPITRIHVRRTKSGPEPVVRPEHCQHCRTAPCLAACKRKAIHKDEQQGTVVIDEDLCNGCGLCARACPFSVITLIRAQGKKRVALKCTHCAEHPAGPACVRSCPTQALVISLAPLPGV